MTPDFKLSPSKSCTVSVPDRDSCSKCSRNSPTIQSAFVHFGTFPELFYLSVFSWLCIIRFGYCHEVFTVSSLCLSVWCNTSALWQNPKSGLLNSTQLNYLTYMYLQLNSWTTKLLNSTVCTIAPAYSCAIIQYNKNTMQYQIIVTVWCVITRFSLKSYSMLYEFEWGVVRRNLKKSSG